MRQLTSLDAQFLAAEDGRTHSHVSAVAVLDPATAPNGELSLDDITRVFAQRLHLLPPLRWRLVDVPLGLDHPYWLDDPDFDLEFHVRELHLPPPGNESQLAEQAARIVSRPLDRTRPLWECYLIGGLQDGHVALLTKVHHALVDGVSGAEILGILFDLSPDGRKVPPPPPGPRQDRRPRDIELLGRGVAALPRQPLRAIRALPATIPYLDTVPTLRSVPGVGLAARAVNRAHRTATRNSDGRLHESPGAAPPAPSSTRASRPTAASRSGRCPFRRSRRSRTPSAPPSTTWSSRFARARSATGSSSTTNLPDKPLLAMVPVSVRTREQTGTFGNRVSVMIVPLPTTEPDPQQRLLRTHEALRSAKERHNAVPADILSRANHLIPPALLARAARLTAGISASRRFAPPYNVIISNVPGPAIPMYIGGARQVANYPVSVILDGVGLNITVLSYQDRIDFGLVADRDLMPNLAGVVDSLQGALAELREAALANETHECTTAADQEVPMAAHDIADKSIIIT